MGNRLIGFVRAFGNERTLVPTLNVDPPVKLIALEKGYAHVPGPPPT